MAREMVYEGPRLQELLQRVIDEHGPARIRPPERRRKGGLFGFFTREVYVITVDDTEPASTPSTSRAEAPAPAGAAGASHPAGTTGAAGTTDAAVQPAGTSMHGASRPARAAGATTARVGVLSSRGDEVQTPLRALVDSTEDEADLSSAAVHDGRATGRTNGAANGTGNGIANGAANGAANGTTGDPTSSSRRSLVDERAQDGSRRASPPPPAVDKPFADVLSEVASSLGEEPGTYRPDPDKLRRPRRPAVVRPFDPPEDTDAAPAGAGDAAGGRSARPGSRPLHEGDLPSVPARLPVVDLRKRTAHGPDGCTTAVGADEAQVLEVTTQAPPVHDPVGDEREAPPDLDATIVHLLRAAGFPDDLLPRTALDPDRPVLEAVFASLPEVPPLPADPGGLVAVVGPSGVVRPLANAVALAVGCPEDEVVVASPNASDRHARAEHRARTALQAAARHAGWRREKVAVVAVYAPPVGTTQGWTREVLRALRPSCVWGMAGATTKPDDVRRWVGGIGGVDALAVTEVDATATPASILSLGIPVARLDEEPATPERWAATVAGLVTRH